MEYRQMLDSKAPFGLDRPALALGPTPVPTWDSSREILSRSPDSERDNLCGRGEARQPLYSVEERRRRDETKWTLVQGILAPVQFVIFAVSLALVIRTLSTGEGYGLATASIVIKTLALYAIMITGCIWEKVVFGRYLFAPAFYWEGKSVV